MDIWAYCLMLNHIHLIAVPEKKENLRLAIGRRIVDVPSYQFQGRLAWALVQERFSSFVMDEQYLMACTRHIESKPVRANPAGQAEQWYWSSAAAHISGQNDTLVNVAPCIRSPKVTGGGFGASHIDSGNGRNPQT